MGEISIQTIPFKVSLLDLIIVKRLLSPSPWCYDRSLALKKKQNNEIETRGFVISCDTYNWGVQSPRRYIPGWLLSHVFVFLCYLWYINWKGQHSKFCHKACSQPFQCLGLMFYEFCEFKWLSTPGRKEGFMYRICARAAPKLRGPFHITRLQSWSHG